MTRAGQSARKRRRAAAKRQYHRQAASRRQADPTGGTMPSAAERIRPLLPEMSDDEIVETLLDADYAAGRVTDEDLDLAHFQLLQETARVRAANDTKETQ